MVDLAAHIDIIGKRYVLHQQIGAGAMGAVYQATDRLTGQIVALKRLSTKRVDAETAPVATLERISLGHEFQTLAALRHPNVISVLDYGFDDMQQPYFTMPLLEKAQSITLAARDASQNQKVMWLIQMLEALVYLHRQGIIHRDLKPDNALVTSTGQVKVLDFGVARSDHQIEDDALTGTPLYIAPEVWLGNAPTPASDLYAVGVIAFQLFTGHAPWVLKGSLQDYFNIITTVAPDMALLEDALTREKLTSSQTLIDASSSKNSTPLDENPTVIARSIDALLEDDDQTKSPRVFDTLLHTLVMIPKPQLGSTDVPLATSTAHPLAATPSNPLVNIVARLLAKRPSARYPNAKEVIDALKAVLSQTTPSENLDLRESFLQAAKFVGRDVELGKLLGGLNDLRAQHGSLWLVGGESGVGKSRLLDELRIRAIVQGTLVVRGQAVSTGGAPYQIWREPLRRLIIGSVVDDWTASVLQQIVPDVAELVGHTIEPAPVLEGSAAEQRLLRAIRDVILNFVKETSSGLILILEDLQWAPKDLAVIESLLPLLGTQCLMLVGSYRIDEDPALPTKLPGNHLLTLQRLDEHDVADLSISMLGNAAAKPHVMQFLQREAEGNVFFLIEVIRALAEEAGQLDQIGEAILPAYVFASGMQRILQRRIEHVAEHYRPLLRIAAVIGRQLDLTVLTQLADDVIVDEWLTACVNAAVIEFQDEQWRFSHDKLREFILVQLSAEQRAAISQQVAATIETSYAAALAEHVHALAYLWSQAGNPLKELEYTQMAGRRSLELDAYADANHLFARALALSEQLEIPVDSQQTVTLHVDIGFTYDYLGVFDLAKQHLNTALTLTKAADNPEQRAAALLHLGWIGMHEGDATYVRQCSIDSAVAAREANAPQALARAIYLTGITYLISGEYAQADTLLIEALASARVANDQRSIADILNAWASVAERLDNFTEAHQRLEEAETIARRIGHRTLLANIEGNLGHLAYTQEHYRDAEIHFEQAATLFGEVGNVFGEAQATYYLGFIDLIQNHTVQALAHLQYAIQTSAQINALPVTLNALTGIARLLIDTAHLPQHEQGQEQAAELLSAVLEHPAQKGDAEIEQNARPLLEKLRATLPTESFAAAVERGRSRDLASIVAQVNALEL